MGIRARKILRTTFLWKEEPAGIYFYKAKTEEEAKR
jgi:hypothetical protein